MITRWLATGIVVTAVGFLPLRDGQAYAGNAGWNPYTGYSARGQFRPLTRAARQTRLHRWRPSGIRHSRSTRAVDRLGSSVFDVSPGYPRDDNRAVAVRRMPAPRAIATPTFATAATGRFRPDDRGRGTVAKANTTTGGIAPTTVFRPTTKKNKPSYEQMMANNQHQYPAYPGPVVAYPAMSSPYYPRYWIGR